MATTVVNAKELIKRFDWQNLQTYPKPVAQALLLAAVLWVIGIGFAVSVHLWAQEAHKAWQLVQQQLDLAKRTAQAKSQDAIYLEKATPRVIQLQAMGVLNGGRSGDVRSEKRLDWIERLESFGYRWPNLYIKYTIDAVKPLTDAPKSGSPAPANVQVMQNEMKLDLVTLHEEDIFRLLADLRMAQIGPLVVSACTAKKRNTPLPSDGKLKSKLAPEVNIECTVKWLSLALTKPKSTHAAPPIAVPAKLQATALVNTGFELPPLGDLFFNNVQREELDRLRLKGEPKPTPAATMATFDGVSSRRAGRATVWINGQAYAEDELPSGIVLQRAANGRITGISPSAAKASGQTGASAQVGGSILIPGTAPADIAKPQKETLK